jgi:uncharacterized protein YbjT (DUF2867 family)
VVVLGATGAVGGEALKELERMPEIGKIAVLARRAADRPLGPKTTWHVVDVLDANSYSQHLPKYYCAICTLGVGQPSKVSREEFRKVDHDAVIAFATACKAAGIEHFALLGSVAASATSSNFYLKSKGELRDGISALGFRRFSVFQPSMLLTPANRYGLMQGIMLATWPLLGPLLQGPLKKYRGIRVETLGRAMARRLVTQGSGMEIVHWPFVDA